MTKPLPHPEVRATASLEGPTNAELVAAIRELLHSFAESTEEGASEQRCLLAIAQQRDLLEQYDEAFGRSVPAPAAMRLN